MAAPSIACGCEDGIAADDQRRRARSTPFRPMTNDTIFALSSGAGPAGIAIVRISGPAAAIAVERLTGRPPPRPRHATRRRFRDADGLETDDGLVLWFPAPASVTGEDVAEFHVHGGHAVVTTICDALSVLPGLRAAEPGAFTRRAFDNGKLDLTAAEGLADLIAAETTAQRRQALRQMDGALGRLYDTWRDGLTRVLAHVEAVIDFADEDLPEGIEAEVCTAVAALRDHIRDHLGDHGRGERIRDGVRIAILGPPNAGKSSLLNRLARRDAAIVHAVPGTTRDIIEVMLDLGGYPVVLADTAGLRETDDPVEREGAERSRRAAAAADVRLVVLDGAGWPAVDPSTRAQLTKDSLIVINKSDLVTLDPAPDVDGQPALPISALTGDGLPALFDQLRDVVASRFGATAEPALTRVRHRTALEEVETALELALTAAEETGDLELAAEDLRMAVRALGRITGQVDVEAVLDVVFRDFCIGK